MLGQVAAFEFRYQVRSPLFYAAAAIIFIFAFVDMAVFKLGQVGGGQVLFNAPHSIVVTHLLFSTVFLFLGAAFVSNVIVRDDITGFGPIIRSSGVTRRDYLLGRFAGAFAASALVLATVPLATFIGTLMPFANSEMLGPNRVSGFLVGYGLFALPDALIMSAILFALATATRSTAGTFVGVIGLFFAYLLGQGLLDGSHQSLALRFIADPFGMSSYMAASRYLTAAELNAGTLPVSPLMIASRFAWSCAALLLLGLTVARFRFGERRISRRRQRKLARQVATIDAAPPLVPSERIPDPRFGTRGTRAQFAARASMEARYIFKSPLYLFPLGIAFLVSSLNVLGATGFIDLPIYALTSVTVPIINESFRTLLVIVAAFYGGELVWRERERKINEIIDATPLAASALMMPKLAGLALVLVATLFVGAAVGLLAQLFSGLQPAPGQLLSWYLLPEGVDILLVAVLALFVSVLASGKYVGWGIMFGYAVLLVVGPSLGLQYPLLIYGNSPAVPLSEMAGTGCFAAAAWWFRLFWAAVALLLLVAANVLWPRGADQGLRRRLSRPRLGPATAVTAVLAVLLMSATGSWIVYNSLVLNSFSSAKDQQRYLADYEKRYFRYARLPQPSVAAVKLDVALYPGEQRAEVRGTYRLNNDTGQPIDRVHLRLLDPDLELVALRFPGARLESNDSKFHYRIYRLDSPMQPGEKRVLSFATRRGQRGFRAAATDTKLLPNGTLIDTLALTPRVGMSDVGLLEDPAVRRKFGLGEAPPFPRLGDLAATRLVPSGADAGFTASDITISTSADQIPMSSGRRLFERVANGRRVARFVSEAPTKNVIPVQSARFAVAHGNAGDVDLAIYYDPAHSWNVARMMTAMRASLEYYRAAFGPYQFRQLTIVENPYGKGGHAYPNSLSVGEGIFDLDLRDPATFDGVTMLVAHETAHQWWGNQVLGARMQGGSVLYETLAQYSALMVLKKLRGETDIRRYLAFQLDRYLSGRRTQVLAEQPLASTTISQQHIVYGKGALAMYVLQDRIGEDAVNRALRRFADRYRLKGAPYPQSLDLIAYLRAEAHTPADQALITDLFERITLYDLKVEQPTAMRRSDGNWLVTVPVEARKFYADSRGHQAQAPLNEIIDVGLFAAHPAEPAFSKREVIGMARQSVHGGRQVFRFVTRSRPDYAGIDPYNMMFDRNAADNLARVTR